MSGTTASTRDVRGLYEKHPWVWAKEKRAKAERYVRGDVGVWTRRARDVIAPRVPVSLFLGFAMNGDTSENTTGWVRGDAAERAEAARTGRRPLGGDLSQRFHELGAYGVPGGDVGGVAPNTVGGDDAWITLATDRQAREVLSRDGKTGPGEWRSVPDQCAIGLANLREDGASVGRNVAVLKSWGDAWDAWRVPVTFAGWSAGPGGTSGHLRKRLAALQGVELRERFAAWGEELLREGVPSDARARSHAWDWYTWVRTAQKLAGAELCAELLGEDLGPWLSWRSIGRAELERLSRGAYTGRDSGASGASRGSAGGGAGSGGSAVVTGSTGPLARVQAFMRTHARHIAAGVLGAAVVGGAAYGGAYLVRERERRAAELAEGGA